MKKLLFILISMLHGFAFADVNIAGDMPIPEQKVVNKTVEKPVKKRSIKKPAKTRIKKKKQIKTPGAIEHKAKLYEIEGYADSNYVRFAVEVVNNKIVTGRKLNQNGPGESVHGQIVDGVLYIDSSTGQNYQVIIPK